MVGEWRPLHNTFKAEWSQRLVAASFAVAWLPSPLFDLGAQDFPFTHISILHILRVNQYLHVRSIKIHPELNWLFPFSNFLTVYVLLRE